MKHLLLGTLALVCLAGCATTDDLNRLQHRTTDLQRQVVDLQSHQGKQDAILDIQDQQIQTLTQVQMQTATYRQPVQVVQPAMPPVVIPCGGKMSVHVAQLDMGASDGGVHVKDATFLAELPCPVTPTNKVGK